MIFGLLIALLRPRDIDWLGHHGTVKVVPQLSNLEFGKGRDMEPLECGCDSCQNPYAAIVAIRLHRSYLVGQISNVHMGFWAAHTQVGLAVHPSVMTRHDLYCLLAMSTSRVTSFMTS